MKSNTLNDNLPCYRDAEGWAWIWGFVAFLIPTVFYWIFNAYQYDETFLCRITMVNRLIPERIFGIVVLLAIGPVAISALRKWAKRCQTNWWEPEDYSTSDWKQVIIIASLAEDKDPIAKSEQENLRKNTVESRIFPLLTAALGIAFGAAMHFLVFPGAYSIGNVTSVSQGNAVVIVGIITAIVSVFVASRQIISKIRAESRQSWINELRKTTSIIIANIVDIFNGKHVDRSALNQHRPHLQLMLNPSEKDHRLLALLIRACVVPSTVIEGDNYVSKEIEAAFPSGPPRGAEVLWDMVRLHRVSADRSDRDKAISHIVKLSHVILKREWERVKTTK